MSILNLIIKPVTAFLLYRIYRDRGGNYSDFAIPGVGNLPGFGGKLWSNLHLFILSQALRFW